MRVCRDPELWFGLERLKTTKTPATRGKHAPDRSQPPNHIHKRARTALFLPYMWILFQEGAMDWPVANMLCRSMSQDG